MMAPETRELVRALQALRDTRTPPLSYRTIATAIDQPTTTVHAILAGKIVSTWPRTRDIVACLGGNPASVEALWEAAARAATSRRNQGPSSMGTVTAIGEALAIIVNREPLPVALLASLPVTTAAQLAMVAEMAGTALEIGCAEEWLQRAVPTDPAS